MINRGTPMIGVTDSVAVAEGLTAPRTRAMLDRPHTLVWWSVVTSIHMKGGMTS